MNIYKKCFLFSFLLPIVICAQDTYTISCPVDASILKKLKVKQIDVAYEDISWKKNLITQYFINENGEANKQTYLFTDSLGITKWRRKELKKSVDGKEITTEISEINDDKTEKLLERNTLIYNDKHQLVKRINELFKAQRIKQIDTYDPANPTMESQDILKFSNKDTIEYRTTTKDATQKKYLFIMKRGGMWFEAERSLTKYADGMEISYKFYKNGMLMNSWEKSKEQIEKEKNANGDVPLPNKPLPFLPTKPFNDTLYTLDPHMQEYLPKPSKKAYMVIKVHSSGDIKKTDIEKIFYPNGLLFTTYNTGDNKRLVLTYKYQNR